MIGEISIPIDGINLLIGANTGSVMEINILTKGLKGFGELPINLLL